MNTQPEALRLAEQLEAEWPEDCDTEAISAELRRLHKVEALREKERKRLVKMSFAKKDLLHALYTALPFVEDALDDATYNHEKVRAKLAWIKAVICKAESK